MNLLQVYKQRPRLVITGLLLLIAAAGIGLAISNISFAPSGSILLAFQRDDQQLFHALNVISGEIKSIPTEGARRLPINARQFSFSTDSKRMAFAGTTEGNNNQIYMANADGSNVLALSAGPRDSDPQLSPDGKTIVFVRSSDYFSALFAVDVDNGRETQLTDYSNDLEPAWSPDSQRLIFTTSRDGFQELYTMSPDGTELQRMTSNERQNDLYASYSPDGQWIAYMSNYSVSDGTGEIWLMKADGSDQQQLTQNDVDDLYPVWSPDGRRIAFMTSHADHQGSDISVYDLATRAVRQLTHVSEYAYDPQWSPDGRWIAYVEDRASSNQRTLLVMRADGSEPRLLPTDPDQPVGWGIRWIR
jgi:Tol biopolymer transport system component